MEIQETTEKPDNNKWVAVGKRRATSPFKQYIKNVYRVMYLDEEPVDGKRTVGIIAGAKAIKCYKVDVVPDEELEGQRSQLLRDLRALRLPGIKAILEKRYGKPIDADYLADVGWEEGADAPSSD